MPRTQRYSRSYDDGGNLYQAAAAQVLGVSRMTIARMADDGRLERVIYEPNKLSISVMSVIDLLVDSGMTQAEAIARLPRAGRTRAYIKACEGQGTNEDESPDTLSFFLPEARTENEPDK